MAEKDPQADRYSLPPDYELLRAQAERGLSTVWLGRQTSTDRLVYLHLPSQEWQGSSVGMRRMLAASTVHAQVLHMAVIPLLDQGTTEHGQFFYVLPAQPSQPWLTKLDDLSLPENLVVPQHVGIAENGAIYLEGWEGACLAEGELPGLSRLQAENLLWGTPAYLAPEVATGALDLVGVGTDVYGLGTLLFQVLTGEAPHPGFVADGCIEAAAANTIPTPPLREAGKSTEALMVVARRAMQTHPKDRYASVGAFLAALALAGEGMMQRPADDDEGVDAPYRRLEADFVELQTRCHLLGGELKRAQAETQALQSSYDALQVKDLAQKEELHALQHEYAVLEERLVDLQGIEREQLVTPGLELEAIRNQLEVMEAEKVRLEVEAAGLREESAALGERLAESDRLRNELEASERSREAAVNALIEESARLEGELRTANEQSETLGEKLSQAKVDIQAIHDSGATLEGECLSQREVLTALHKERESLQGEVVRLGELVTAEQEEISGYRQDLNDQVDRSRSLGDRIERLESALAAAKQSTEEREERLAALIEVAGVDGEVVGELSEEVERLTLEKRELESKTSELAGRLESSQDELARLHEVVAQHGDEKTGLLTSLDEVREREASLGENLKEAQIELSQQEAYTADLQCSLEERAKEALEAKEERRAAIQETDNYRENEVLLRSELVDVEQKLNEVLEARGALEESNLSTLAKLEGAEQRLAVLVEEGSALKEEKRQLECERGQIQEEMRGLQVDRDRLSETSQGANAELAKVREKLQGAQEYMQRLNEQCDGLEQTRGRLEAELEVERGHLSSCRDELRTTQEELEQMESQYRVTLKDIASCEEEDRRIQTEYSQLLKQHGELDEEHSELLADFAGVDREKILRAPEGFEALAGEVGGARRGQRVAYVAAVIALITLLIPVGVIIQMQSERTGMQDEVRLAEAQTKQARLEAQQKQTATALALHELKETQKRLSDASVKHQKSRV
ncbi:MAG: hypothetical protein ACYTGH_19930, partial [Planctomycetota bacterium]